jgi:hypothetical protein
MKPTNSIQEQLLQVVTELPSPQQQAVLKFACSLRQQEIIRRWHAISDEEAAALKAEFADEDLALAEAALTDYLPMLQQEDEA